MLARQYSTSSPIRLLALCALALGACAAPAGTPNDFPTAPATATALPPTAAATAQGTAAFVAPTAVAATAVMLHGPNDVAFDADGNWYVSVCDGPQVVKINGFGKLTAFASPQVGGFSGDGGPAAVAEIACATGLAFDRDGNLYVADSGNNRIRRIDRNGIITTVAGNGTAGSAGDGGPATAAQLQTPNGIALDTDGNLYVVDTNNNRVRKVDRQGIITTLAGNGAEGFSGDGGPASAAALHHPANLAIDAQGNVYLSDTGNSRVRKVDGHGVITTIAGDGGPTVAGDGGLATAATLSRPLGLTFDAGGNLYIACAPDAANFDARVRKVDGRGIITTVVGKGPADFSGDGGPAKAASLRSAGGIHFDATGNLFIVDYDNGRVRKVDTKGIITTVVGGAP